MPYPNEHSARIKDPALFKKGDENWGSKDIATGIRIILGILKSNGEWDTQAYRFKADKFTASEAKQWLKDHDVKYIAFEPAGKDAKSDESQDIERRIISFEQTELRVEDDKPMLVGYAAKTGIFTDLGWFREKIAPGAFGDVLEDDIRCLKNHDPNLILGRTTNGTLRIKENTVGLHYEDDLPDTNTGRDVREEVRRKDITGCSFAFTIAEDQWLRFDDERLPERTIVKLKRLYDVGPVTYPAYPDTTVAARSMEMDRKKRSDEGQYECECIECGHTLKTDEHCKDLKCPKCGGQMRRKERPGPGQKSDDGSNNEISAEQMAEVRRKYRSLGYMIARNRSAEA